MPAYLSSLPQQRQPRLPAPSTWMLSVRMVAVVLGGAVAPACIAGSTAISEVGFGGVAGTDGHAGDGNDSNDIRPNDPGGGDDANTTKQPTDTNTGDPNTNTGDSNTTMPPPEGAAAEVIITGRTLKVGGATRMAWPGIAIGLRFKGTEVAVDMQHVPALFRGEFANAWFDVELDGKAKGKVQIPAQRQKVSIATGLSNAEHSLWLRKRTEAIIGVTDYFGVDLGDGQLLSPPARPAHRIEVVGSSAETGYGVEGAAFCTGYRAEEQNCNLAWPGIMGKMLDAEVMHTTYAGKGLVYSIYPDNAATCRPMGALYDTVIPINLKQPQTCTAPSAAEMYDFAGYAPQVVLLDLTNIDERARAFDLPNSNDLDYLKIYQPFIQRILQRAPKAFVGIVIIPTVHPDSRAWVVEQVTAVRDNFAAAGQNQVKVIFAEDKTSDPTSSGCDAHPSALQQKLVGQSIAAQVKSAMGW